jgi:hypothetical protein
MNDSRNLTEQALIQFRQSMLPHFVEGGSVELDRIRDALTEGDTWSVQDEWRIFTWFDSRIVRNEIDGKAGFRVSVECDGQTFSCRCPSVERAFLFLKLYQHLIIHQYYSAGPPWMEIDETAHHRS